MTARQAVRSDAFRAFCSPRQCPVHRFDLSPRTTGARRTMQRNAASTERNGGKPILLFDVMDTLVYDPFYTEMPLFFDMKFQELLNAKDPKAWPQFERGEISEQELMANFFKDKRPVNAPGLINAMASGYRWIDGIEYLLVDIREQGLEMHAITNYPEWYKRIEAKLALSRYLPWTFVSCEGPMKGLRKPDPRAFKAVSETLGVAPEQLLLIDDRQDNVVGALESGWGALQFNNAGALRRDLEKRRILDAYRKLNPG